MSPARITGRGAPILVPVPDSRAPVVAYQSDTGRGSSTTGATHGSGDSAHGI